MCSREEKVITMSVSGSKVQSLQELLWKHRRGARRQVHDGSIVPYTHTRMPNARKSLPGGSYAIPISETENFFRAYGVEWDRNHGRNMHILEANDRTTPLKIDIDLRFDHDILTRKDEHPKSVSALCPVASPPRILTNTHIDALVATVIKKVDYWAARETMREWTDDNLSGNIHTEMPDMPYNPRYGVVFQRDRPYVGDSGVIKDGLHIVFPELVTSSLTQFIVRGSVIESLKTLLQENTAHEREVAPLYDLVSRLKNCKNAIEDMYDKAVISRNPWMMYGSDKPGKENNRYKIVAIVHVGHDYKTTREDPQEFITRIKSLLPPSCTCGVSDQAQEIIALAYHLRMRCYGQPRPVVRMRSDFAEDEALSLLVSNGYVPTPKVSPFKGDTADKPVFKDYAYASDLVLKCLSTERAESEDGWFRVGFALSNLVSSGTEDPEKKSLKDVWIEWSRRPAQYANTAAFNCQNKWAYFERTLRANSNLPRLGLPSLEEAAKLDNPEMFETIQNEHMHSRLIHAVSSTDYDIAQIVVSLDNNRQRYKCVDQSTKLWYEYHTDSGLWTKDKGYQPLALAIPNRVYPLMEQIIIDEYNHRLKLNGGNSQDEQMSGFKKKRKERLRLINSLKSSGKGNAICSFIMKLLYDARFPDRIDQNPDLVALGGGDVYDLLEHNVRRARPSDMVSFSTGQSFHPCGLGPAKTNDNGATKSAEASPDTMYHVNHPQVKAFREFIASLFPDKDVCHYMLKWLASHFDGHTGDELFHVLIGTGANGKSKLQSLVSQMLGSYFATVTIKMFTGGRADASSATSHYEHIKNKRSVWVQEPEQGERMNSGVLKELTGGDKVYSRGLFQDGAEFKPQAKFALVANHKPKVSAEDAALWRRVRVVRFRRKFKKNPNPNNPLEAPRDEHLEAKLTAMAQAGHWYLLSVYYPIYKREGIISDNQIPAKIYKETEQYREEFDEIADFIAVNMRLVEDAHLDPDGIVDDIRMEVCTEELTQRFSRFVTSRRPRSVYLRYDGNTERIVDLFSKRSSKWGLPKSLGDGRRGWPQWCWKPSVVKSSVW